MNLQKPQIHVKTQIKQRKQRKKKKKKNKPKENKGTHEREKLTE